MYEMVIYGVSFDLVGKQPIVLLKTADGNKFLPIWIGHPEAAAILMKLQGASTPRPMTHDLVTDMLGELDAQVVRDHGHRAAARTPSTPSITVQQNGSEIEIDSRPSDAIAAGRPRRGADLRGRRGDRGVGDRVRGRGRERGGDRRRVQAVPRPRHPGRVRRGARKKRTRALAALDLALGQPEDLFEQLLQAVARERPAVRAREVLQHPLLAVVIDERHAARLLVALQPRDELQARVDRLDDRAVGVRDLLPELADERVVLGHGLPAA